MLWHWWQLLQEKRKFHAHVLFCICTALATHILDIFKNISSTFDKNFKNHCKYLKRIKKSHGKIVKIVQLMLIFLCILVFLPLLHKKMWKCKVTRCFATKTYLLRHQVSKLNQVSTSYSSLYELWRGGFMFNLLSSS